MVQTLNLGSDTYSCEPVSDELPNAVMVCAKGGEGQLCPYANSASTSMVFSQGLGINPDYSTYNNGSFCDMEILIENRGSCGPCSKNSGPGGSCNVTSSPPTVSTSPPPAPTPTPTPYLTYKANLTGANSVPPIATTDTATVAFTLYNRTYARGYFFVNGINQMTMAHLHSGAVGKNGPPIAWAFNGTYGPISGSFRAPFTFNPSLNNISSLLSAGLVYFNIHTTANPGGELRGQMAPASPTVQFG